jgi:hypothetical protein
MRNLLKRFLKLLWVSISMVLLSTAAGHIAFFYAVVSVRSMFLLSFVLEKASVPREIWGGQ